VVRVAVFTGMNGIRAEGAVDLQMGWPQPSGQPLTSETTATLPKPEMQTDPLVPCPATAPDSAAGFARVTPLDQLGLRNFDI
jgi:hypothetical protein